MRSTHVYRSARDYFVDGIFWGDDEEGVIVYLRAKGVPPRRDHEGLGTDRAGRDIADPARVNGHFREERWHWLRVVPSGLTS